MKRRNKNLSDYNNVAQSPNVPTGVSFAEAPRAQSTNFAPIQLPSVGSNFQVVGNGMPMGLSRFTCVDQYGRVYTPNMVFAPQPHSSPVPVPIPSQIIQVSPVITPVALVPYSTQNQALYQYDED